MMLAHASLAQVPKGKTTEIQITSSTYPNGRHAWVYTPAGYPASCNSDCNLMIVFDGAQYLGEMPLPEILDSLAAVKRVGPTVAILFDNGEPPARLEDLANSKKFASFVADELIPRVRRGYAVTRSADRTVIAGSSAGGLEAAYIALYHPDIFGNVLSQSGAFWRGNEGSNSAPYEWLTQQYAASPRVNVRFLLDVGSLETHGALGGAAPSLLDANRRLRDVLKSKGYALDYLEVPGGYHHPESWAKRFSAAVATLLH
jgi:enterochelin esterase family protein